MRIPQRPPALNDLLAEIGPARLKEVICLRQEAPPSERYLHWDELRHRPPPAGLTHREWWLVEKLARGRGKPIGLANAFGRRFHFSVPDFLLEDLHQIDRGSNDLLGVAAPNTISSARDSYLMSSLMEEAITSSQFEGAMTTREVAKEMIRNSRPPADKSERMILNNFVTMQSIGSIRSSHLSPGVVLDIHRPVTHATLDDE